MSECSSFRTKYISVERVISVQAWNSEFRSSVYAKPGMVGHIS